MASCTQEEIEANRLEEQARQIEEFRAGTLTGQRHYFFVQVLVTDTSTEGGLSTITFAVEGPAGLWKHTAPWDDGNAMFTRCPSTLPSEPDPDHLGRRLLPTTPAQGVLLLSQSFIDAAAAAGHPIETLSIFGDDPKFPWKLPGAPRALAGLKFIPTSIQVRGIELVTDERFIVSFDLLDDRDADPGQTVTADRREITLMATRAVFVRSGVPFP